jgi:DNA-binding XRE family transcriptional regulator
MTEQELYTAVGIRIRKARQSLSMRQEDLRRAAGLTRTSITNIENGHQKVLLHTLLAIARTLGVTCAALMPEMYGGPS